jgi:hypothetical protein
MKTSKTNDHSKKQAATKGRQAKKSVKTAKFEPKAKNQPSKSTAEATNGKHPGGRPSKRDTINLQQVAILASFGLTDIQIAQALGISERTLNYYKKDDEFLQSLKSGKAISDERVERALYERAIGYEHPDTDIRVVANQIVETALIKYYPPDTTACIFWLKNRKPDVWKDKLAQQVGLDAATIEVILSALPPDFARAVRLKLAERIASPITRSKGL